VAICLANLAMVYAEQKKYSQAEPLFQRAMEIWEKTTGFADPHAAACAENYAEMLRRSKRSREAAMVEARTKQSGPRNP
jgi:hypothetical protein